MTYPYSDSGHSQDARSHATGIDNPYEHLAPLSTSARTVQFAQDPDPFASTPSLHSSPSVQSLRTDPFASSTSLASTSTAREYDLGTRDGTTEEDESIMEKEPLTKQYSVSLNDSQWSVNSPGEENTSDYYPPQECASCLFVRPVMLIAF